MSHEFSEIPIAQTAEQQWEVNPYAAPLTEGRLVAKYDPSAPVGIWRVGDALIMHADATLPHRCILTNAPCDQTERRVYLINSIRLLHITSGFLALFFAGGGIGMLVSNWRRMLFPAATFVLMGASSIWLFFRKRPDAIPIGYSYWHRARLRRLAWRCVGAILFCLGLGCFPAGIALLHRPEIMITLVFGGIPLLLIGAILFAAFGFPLRFERMSGPYFLIRGCGRIYMHGFPEASAVEAGRLTGQFTP